MNWDALGAIAEFVGAIAVIATLIYLAIQIRQNTRSMDENRKVELSRNYQQLAELRTSMLSSVAESAELASIYVKVSKMEPGSLSGLTEEEIIRLKYRETVNLTVNEVTLYQYENGLIDQRAYESSRKVFRRRKALWKLLELDTMGRDVDAFDEWILELDERGTR